MRAEDREYVHVTEYFHPDTASTGQYMTDLAVGLSERGLDLTVYTGQPNYHSGTNQKQPRQSNHQGVQVNRIRAPLVSQTSLIRRLYNWGLFTLWMSVVLLFSSTDRERELMFVSNPPFLPLAMWFVATVRGWDYTYILYDVYPDTITASGHLKEGGVVDRVWSWLNRRVFRGAKNIVALGPAMRENVIEYGGPGFNDDKVSIIHNWADPEFITPREKSENWFSQEHGLVDEFTVLYSGNIGYNHDLETVVRAAAEFKNDSVRFVIIGEGDKKDDIVQLVNRLGLSDDTVLLLPYQDFEDLPYTLTSGDVTVVTVSEGMKGVCVSSKLYTSMAVGQPILVISHPQDDEARIVTSADAGKQAKQGDVDAVVDAITEWQSDSDSVARQGANARSVFERQFTKTKCVDEYYDMLTQ